MICLPPQSIDKFKQALVNGKLKPEQLANMTSEARHKALSNVVGAGEAKAVNALFESKLLLKNQQQGYLSWAKKVSGIKPEAKRDLISRIQKMDKFLSPEDEKLFLKDLASTRLGIDVTAKEAKQIANMSIKVQETAAKQRPNGTFANEKDRMAYGYAKVDMGTYLSDKKLLAERKGIKGTLLSDPIENASKLAGVAKSVRASFDNSAIFRQGWKTLWTNPIIWQKNARKTFSDLARVGIKNQDVQREVMADIVSRPNYSQYQKMKLALGNVEEDFPSSIQNKIPIIGRAFKASEAAYENFLYRTRADVADKYIEIAKAGGVNVNDKDQLANIGKLINSLTGRGSLGAGEGSKAVSSWTNNLFFSIRFLKSNIDTLTAHQLSSTTNIYKRDASAKFVRKQAAINLLKIVSGTAAVLATADALLPGSVEKDPRSSNFGKIKVKNTTFDVTGGMGSILVLAARQATGKSKSSSTGIISDYGSGFGDTSRLDGVTDFITGKASPAAAVVRDIMKGKDFDGNKVTPTSAAKDLFVPLPVSNSMDNMKKPDSAPWLLTVITDGLGISTGGNIPTRNVSQNLSGTQEAFKAKVGEKRFNAANDTYNKRYNQWLKDHKTELNSLPTDEQQSLVTSIRGKIQKKIYAENNFKPKKSSKPTGTRKTLLDSVK